MKLRVLATVSLLFLLTACTNTKKEAEPTASPTAESSDYEARDYLYAKAKDTVRMTLKSTYKLISGELHLLPFAKDSRRGTITDGQMKGDTLFAIYKSTQEGQESECEIALLKRGDEFVLSDDFFGESNYKYNDAYTKGWFKDRKKITFEGYVLKRIH